MNNKAAMLGLAVLAFLVAAVLVIMIFRMLFGGRLRMPGGRARQARLGIVDAFDLDRQRQLIIVRRDNTEHLIMIGGPNDVVIESEIIRAEVRDVRDPRRDPVLGSGLGEGRIPAPAPALARDPAPFVPDRAVQPPPATPARAEESSISAAAPVAAPMTAPVAAAEPPRAPTFPLPPRRPPTPERRPPPPPQLPEGVSRGDDVPSLSGQPAAFAPAPSTPTLPMEPAAPPPVAAPLPPPPPATGPAPAVGPAAAPPRRPPFLKPLSARPPIRPLQRSTPQAPANAAPAPSPVQPVPPPAAAAPAPPPPRPAPPPSAPPQATANDDSRDALESLEEEMAKLLGRG